MLTVTLSMKRFNRNRWLILTILAYAVALAFVYDYYNSQLRQQESLGTALPLPLLSEETELSPVPIPEVNVQHRHFRALINSIEPGAILQTNNGWLTISGLVAEPADSEVFFVIIESHTQHPPVAYLQAELRPDERGEWQAAVKYGTPGFTYRTYIIATQDIEAAENLRRSGMFTSLPEGFYLASPISTNLVH